MSCRSHDHEVNMAALGKVLFLAVFFLACLRATYCEELKPFVAWSNSDALSSIKPSISASDMVRAMVKHKDNNLFVVFLADELSFDDIVKHGGVYSDSKAGDFANLKSILSSSKSQLWSGVSDSTDDISSTLASLLDSDLTTVDATDVLLELTDVSTWHGVVTVVMNNEQSIQNQDAVLGAVDKSLKRIPYVGIYSQSDSSTETNLQRSRRDVAEQPHLGKRAATNEGDTVYGDTCTVGGVFRDNATSNSSGEACMLFCIKNLQNSRAINFHDHLSINMTVKLKNSTSNNYCMLTHPSSVSYCCQADLNNAPECMDERFPFVILKYDGLTSDNSSANNMTNLCLPHFFGNLSQDLGDEVLNGSAVLKFVFPNNFGVNHTEAYNDAWNIRIHPSVTYYSANGSAVYTTTANITYGRIPPNMQLYEEFKVPNGVSYACAASDFQRYGPEVNNTNTNTSDPLKSQIAIGNESMITTGDVEILTLPFLQVQPYKIRASSSSFSEAYNCVGYFTFSSLMGVFTTLVLLLILYVSLMCSFSMNSIEHFEDPRGQTITVEKLH